MGSLWSKVSVFGENMEYFMFPVTCSSVWTGQRQNEDGYRLLQTKIFVFEAEEKFTLI